MYAVLVDRLDLNSLNEVLFYIQSNIYSTDEATASLGGMTLNDVRLEYVGAAEIQLAGMYGTSGAITVNGEHVSCTTFKTVAPTDNLITAAGADAGGACAASTFYYAYVSNSLATTFPSDLRLSATAPTAGYLGASGNALNWKLVGWVQTTAATAFASSLTQRLVCSKFNPRLVNLYVTESTSHSYTTATWRGWNGSSTSTKLEFITHEDHLGSLINISAIMGGNVGVAGTCGIGIDSATAATGASILYHASVLAAGEGVVRSTQAALSTVLAAGYHYVLLLEYGAASSLTYDDGTVSMLLMC